jgi:hypothetical protein
MTRTRSVLLFAVVMVLGGTVAASFADARRGGRGIHARGHVSMSRHVNRGRSLNRTRSVNRSVNRNRNVNRNVNRNRNVNVNRNRNVNVNVNRGVVRGWVARPYFGTTVAGVVLGSIITAAAVGVVPTSPDPSVCWYWTDQARAQGYWAYCDER